jgi:protein involved in polysaccharide export with SLBB domain
MFVSHITRPMKIIAFVLGLALLSAAPLEARAAGNPPSYVIHPNDQLDVQVFGDPSLSQNVTV